MTFPPLPPPPLLGDLCDRGTVSLFLDFDGTLIDIAAGPDAIAVPAGLASRLEALSDRLGGRVALISGRGLDNIAQHIGPMRLARAGSHGAHRLDAMGQPLGDAPLPLDTETVAELSALATEHGALFESKAHGAALHYRADPSIGLALEQAALLIADRAGLTAKRGKCVIELVRPGAEKGGAVDAFMARAPFLGSTPIFIGDDVTDEDGFAAATRHGGFGIAVGERLSGNAGYSISLVKDVHAWLNL